MIKNKGLYGPYFFVLINDSLFRNLKPIIFNSTSLIIKYRF